MKVTIEIEAMTVNRLLVHLDKVKAEIIELVEDQKPVNYERQLENDGWANKSLSGYHIVIVKTHLT